LPVLENHRRTENLLRFSIRGRQGELWFDIKEAHGFTRLKVLSVILWGVASFMLTMRSGYQAWVGWPLALAGLLAVQYLDVTNPWLRQHDVEGHREYIDHLSSTATLPAVQQGCETWQPPLYYLVASAWRGLLVRLDFSYDDPFRPVQFLATALYLTTVILALLAFHHLHLDGVEALGALSVLALLPGNLFFAGRINNDTLLPVLGLAVMFVLAKFAASNDRRWLGWLAAVLPATLATKGSSLAIVGAALSVVFLLEMRASGWRSACFRIYLTGLPSAIWLLFWWWRNIAQTGDPLYVNSVLPDTLRIYEPTWRRLLSFDFKSFLAGQNYYSSQVRLSYPTALVTSILRGEYNMDDFGFRWTWLVRFGCVGMLVLWAAGIVLRPRAELRAGWAVCLCLALAQMAIMVVYAAQFPFACNQNMRFCAQAFVPFSCLWGLGVSQLWSRLGWIGRLAFAVAVIPFSFGLGEFYWRLLF
jgi:hypothetical protein